MFHHELSHKSEVKKNESNHKLKLKIMEKETYIAPTIEVINIETQESMLAGSDYMNVGGTSTGIYEGTKFRDGGDDFWW